MIEQQLLKLIDKIEKQDAEYVADKIHHIDKETLLQEFENENALLHYVFSCNNINR